MSGNEKAGSPRSAHQIRRIQKRYPFVEKRIVHGSFWLRTAAGIQTPYWDNTGNRINVAEKAILKSGEYCFVSDPLDKGKHVKLWK